MSADTKAIDRLHFVHYTIFMSPIVSLSPAISRQAKEGMQSNLHKCRADGHAFMHHSGLTYSIHTSLVGMHRSVSTLDMGVGGSLQTHGGRGQPSNIRGAPSEAALVTNG